MVLVTITLEGTGAQPFSFNPSSFTLVDDAGYLVYGVYTLIPEELGIPLLETQDVAPGATVTGSLAFQAFTSATLSAVMYWPQSDRAVTLARLGSAPPPAGTTVPVLANDGSEMAQITVRDIQDPFEGYDPNSSPQRGNHYVLVTVTVENTGVRATRVDPNAFSLLDSEGFLTRPSSVNRGEDPPLNLEYTDPLAPGDNATGAVAFEVLSGTTLTSAQYMPSSDRFIEVAALGAAAGIETPAGATPIAADPDANGAASAATGDGDCAGSDEWSTGTVERFTTAGGIVGGVQPLEEQTVDGAPAIRQAAADIAALAAEQESSAPPPAATEFNAMVANYFTRLSQELDFFAEGLEIDEVTQMVVAIANLGLVEQSFAAGGEANLAFEALLETCPLA